ncbi:MAG: RNA-directed DNA polymerase, partial [Planctomycetes bacterium]|nr:RNA-directed DNA polymerase [Planctomycetota bacterium]
MSRWTQQYDTLYPHHRFLSDEIVLVQAWKKAHDYIRRYNWFADCLELDHSTIGLKHYVENWQRALSPQKLPSYRPAPMRLVLAPKPGRWGFVDQKWQPELGDDQSVALRPLAHLRMRDQVSAAAAMLCLADVVETAQGETCPDDLATAREKGVVSYGNRLFCIWEGDIARHSFAGAKTYRQYYTDYSAFLRRPDKVATLEQQRLVDGESLAIIQLDLKGFFDRVDRDQLIEKLQAECAEAAVSMGFDADPRFWRGLARIFDWRWSRSDAHLLGQFADTKEGMGLPQGLVASGFLANAYLLDFDRKMSRQVGRTVPKVPCALLDYCRYVDDMRLVIKFRQDQKEDITEEAVAAWIDKGLRNTAPNQRINPKKMDILHLDDSPARIRIAATVQEIQERASGPIDVRTAEQLLHSLEGLFPLAEQASRDRTPTGETGPQSSEILDLLNTTLDVRPDTLERFAANRWRSVFRSLRPLRNGAHIVGTSLPAELVALDERAAIFARRLVRRWCEDPSHMVLLKVALDTYPDRNLLKVVRSLLAQHLFDDTETAAALICRYVVADLLKAGAT